jgi:hypothetical protein
LVINFCKLYYRNFWRKWHYINFDKFLFYKSYEFYRKKKRTAVGGSARKNRKNWLTEFMKPTILKFKRGESRKIQHGSVARQTCCSAPFNKFRSHVLKPS